ncbi:MAG: hypothetical protein MJD61_17150 [Proteobacteria bacterium]|nr:hypothetical protein [Pseudomonadota bacterium]
MFRDPGSNSRALERASQALAQVGREGREAQPAGTLPYGERRALEIGVAIAAEPRRLLLDEPAHVAAWPTHRIARQGIGWVPEERRVFPTLSFGLRPGACAIAVRQRPPAQAPRVASWCRPGVDPFAVGLLPPNHVQRSGPLRAIADWLPAPGGGSHGAVQLAVGTPAQWFFRAAH